MAEFSSQFAIASSRVITPDGETAAAIVIENETIVRVVERSAISHEVPITDFGDLVISPGLIDTHVHINEPGTDWEGFQSATAAAAAGGITTLIDMPLNSIPVTTNVTALQAKRAAADAANCRANVHFYGGLISSNESELPALLQAGVLGVKAFLCDSGLDEFPAATEKELRAALEILAPHRVPLLAHAEIVPDHHSPKLTDPTSYQQYATSRPPEFELAAIRLLIELCREYQTPIHIVHLATQLALPMIEAAKAEGLPLTVETCPHYLFFNDASVGAGDTRYKCAPPIRDEANRASLCRAVESGLIDTIGSDHSPCPVELKNLNTGNFETAWGGIAGLQLTLPVVNTVGHELGWTPQLIAQRCSTRPAEIFGLSGQTGSIVPGLAADLTVWEPEPEFHVDAGSLLHRHPVSPYDGSLLHGVTHRTYVRGDVVYDRESTTR